MNILELFRAALSYDPDLGVFRWVKPSGRRVKAGDLAGSMLASGHMSIGFNGTRYLAHRVAWLFIYGEWPPMDVDHINRDPSDNRACNLRLASRSQNNVNAGIRSTNTSGIKGVYWDKKASKWVARVQRNGRQCRVGAFDALADASAAVRVAYVAEFGAFAA